MSSLRKLTPLFRLIFASLIVAIALVLLYKGASSPINAQQPPAVQERRVENIIPKHVPIEVKLTKEKEKNWKDLKNENWAKDFEIEVTNTGDKPIYTFSIRLSFDVTNEYGYDFTADILYGRSEISNPVSKATADEIPLKPGESKTFTLGPGYVREWEWGHRKKGYRLPTKVKITLGGLSFGDGTGLMGDKYGTVVPVPYHRSSLVSPPPGKRQSINWPSRAIDSGGRVPKSASVLPAVLPREMECDFVPPGTRCTQSRSHPINH